MVVMRLMLNLMQSVAENKNAHTEEGYTFHGLELELLKWYVLVIGLIDDVFGAEIKLTFVFAALFVGVEIVKGAVPKEILDVDFVFFHVIEVEPFGIGR